MTKQQVFYIHGATSFGEYQDFLEHLRTKELRSPHGIKSEFWPSRLREELGAEFEVFTPSMPNSDNAKYEEWKIWFERHFEYLRDGVILVGWSQGGYFLAKYLTEETLPLKAKALYLIAAPCEPDDFGAEDGGDFSFETSKLPQIMEQIPQITLMHSEDDFVVPYEHARKYKKLLPKAELVTFTDRNHFLQPEFPELMGRLRSAG